MAKFCGKIGFGESKEVRLGVWKEEITEKPYSGDVNRNAQKYQQSESTVDNMSINSEISVISDTYLIEHFAFIKYVEYMGVKWKVTNVALQHPRLILTLGGVYNSEQTASA